MYLKTNIISLFLISTLFFLPTFTIAQEPSTTFEKSFLSPPDSARPRTWWHLTGGNVTKEGITKDLEWMKRVGIAGFQLADVSYGSGQSVENKLMFGTPEWLDAVRFAATEADRMNLEMAIFSSAGWSIAGGPWVKPEQAMKKLVWSETTVKGPQEFSGKLPNPPSCNGPFQDYDLRRNPKEPSPDPEYYKDVKVIAYHTPPDEQNMEALHPLITTNNDTIDITPIHDGNLNSSIKLASEDGKAWIQYSFKEPVSIQAITISSREGIPGGEITSSIDGITYITLISLPGTQLYRGGRVRTFSFPATNAKYFRIELTGAPLSPDDVISQPQPKPARSYNISEIILHTGNRINRWEEKAGFSFLFDYKSVDNPNISASSIIHLSEILDLSSKMDPDGTLHWKVPEGNWTILRIGCSLTGAKNRPAVPTGLGYEVDKLSKNYTESYLKGYLDPIEKELGDLFNKRLKYLMLDSWECGMQNWTDDILREFQNRRGYDPVLYLPALTGRVTGNADISDRFLWDFRRTLADMFAESFYATVMDYAHSKGMKTYGEASGVSLEVMEDALLNKKNVDIPMGEFWFNDLHPSSMYYVDIRGAASASHAYGKTFVAAESFTGGNYESPYDLKKLSDYWFTRGVNRIVFHTSAHQPLDTKPGNTMVGTHFNRNITWANLAEPFVTYLARNSFMLQQGLFVADIAYLLDESAPSTMPFWGGGLQPVPPEGYDYDYINTDVLLNRISVDTSGKLVLPDGMSYSVLILPDDKKMTLPVLKKIIELTKAGATVIGPKVVSSPSLSGYPKTDLEVRELAEVLWGDLDGISRTIRYVGNGMVVWGEPVTKVFNILNIPKDVEYSKGLDTEISWIHRKTNKEDIYFISSQNDFHQHVDFRFRISGKEPELWYSDKGTKEQASYHFDEGLTVVPIDIEKNGSLFVVFRNDTKIPVRNVAKFIESVIDSINGPWEVNFPPDLGAPEKIQFAKLISWTEHPDSGVKYFSGTATYKKDFKAPKSWFNSNDRILLDLGEVKDIAEISLNGKILDTLWKEPYKSDVTGILKPGINQLEIKITNGWTNRLYGDQQVSDDKKILDAFIRRFGGDWTLKESGLIGPVRVILRE